MHTEREREGKREERIRACMYVCARACVNYTNCKLSDVLLKIRSKWRRILAEYQYRISNHVVWEDKKIIDSYTLNSGLELCVRGDSRTSFKRRWCGSRGGDKVVERSCSKINYAKYFSSSEYEIVAASSLYTRRKLNLLSHGKL